nr:ribonuclease H-like domain-containing protein [Tanacetum cinerariifolium]
APTNQDRGRRDNYRQGSKAEEQAPKALMAIDGVGWDWSYMANDKEDHALVTDEVAHTEFALMANTSAKSKVFDNSLCSKDCKKNNDSLNGKKEGVDGKLAGLLKASKDLDNLIESQRSDKIKDGLGYSAVPPPPAQLYLSPKKDLSWTGLPKYADDTVTDYSRPSPTVKSPDFVMKKKACFNCGDFNHLAYDCGKRVRKSFTPKLVAHKPYKPSQRPVKTNLNGARPNKTSFNKQAHSYAKRPFHRTSAVGSPHRAPWVPTVNLYFLPVNRKFSPGNRKFPTASRKFPTGSTKCSTADIGIKGKVVKPSAWQFQNNIDDKGYWDSGCSRHMTGNISYLSDFEPFDGGYVSFWSMRMQDYWKKDYQNRTPTQHNMYSIDLNNIVPYRDLTCLVAKASADECMLWHRRLGHLNFKIMNKLVRHNLVRGLPTKCFENDHTCTACLKGKQHKASCKSKLVNSVSKPLHTLHMDLFGPTFVSSISHKGYCLVVTDDFSRFTWTFFLKSKDETSGILKEFITEIENLKDLKVKIIRYKGCSKSRSEEKCIFLRYIALPNWAHDALLEYSSSKPQDHCSTEVSEGSGNPNPTTSTSNPPVDQMETLTVETPIPTISSPVPTAYSTDSQEPSSDARLI